ncbi:MAG: hypothetical protein AB1646_10015 [Thermodesulfobacteriota bacterium]
MSVRFVVACVAIVMACCGIAQSQTVHKCGIEDQVGLDVTVYGNNLGLVEDVRKVTLPKGKGELMCEGVASALKPYSVHVKSLHNPPSFSVLEQSYEHGLMNQTKLLDKYVGQKMKIIESNWLKDRKETVDAVLLSNRGGQVFQIGDEIYLGHPGTKVLPRLPGNLITGPTLVWRYANETDAPQKIAVSYETGKIAWSADYVLVLRKDDNSADMVGWINLNNKSGALFKEAHFRLLARKPPEPQFRSPGMHPAAQTQSQEYAQYPQSAPQPYYPQQPMPQQGAPSASFDQNDGSRQSLPDYHVYDLPQKTTVRQKQIKQVNLVDAVGVPIKKEYIVHRVSEAVLRGLVPPQSQYPLGSQEHQAEPQRAWFAEAKGGKAAEEVSERRKAILKDFFTKRFVPQDREQPVNTYLRFKNAKEHKLGVDLPAGSVRLYRHDEGSTRQRVATVGIKHTPKDGEINLNIGTARDIKAERIQTDYKGISNRVHESEWEITLRNNTAQDVTVGLVEPLFGQWEILSSSHKYEKVDAFTIRFDVGVPKDQEVKVRYRLSLGL